MARTLEYPFLDSDAIAEQHTGRTVAEIFADEGEEGFRELESAVLQVNSQMHLDFTLDLQGPTIVKVPHKHEDTKLLKSKPTLARTPKTL